MSEQSIYHLSYISTGCDHLKFEQIKDLLECSVKNNKRDGITGILIYCNKLFFQILEGDKSTVDALFDKLCIDPRHDNIIKLQACFVERRQFENWNMAFKSYNKELRMLDDFNTEAFYSYIKERMVDNPPVSLRLLLDFFDLNG